MSRSVYYVTCPMCGEVFDERLRKCPNCRAKNRKDVCRTCGNEISKQARKCPACGAHHIQKLSDPEVIAILATIIFALLVLRYTANSTNNNPKVQDTSNGIGNSVSLETSVKTDGEANAKNEEISREDYMAECAFIPYDDVARNPNSYVGDNVMFSGTVIQVSETAFDLFDSNSVDFRVETSDGVWYVSYNRPEGESRILEGDYITCYGECDGITTYISVLGGNVTVPKLIMKYHD